MVVRRPSWLSRQRKAQPDWDAIGFCRMEFHAVPKPLGPVGPDVPPAPSDNVHGPVTRAEAIDARELERPTARPANRGRTVRPSKAEYIRSFATAPLPACVKATRSRMFERLMAIEAGLNVNRRGYNRRLKKAVAAYSYYDLACAYDPAIIARIGHHATSHSRRLDASSLIAR